MTDPKLQEYFGLSIFEYFRYTNQWIERFQYFHYMYKNLCLRRVILLYIYKYCKYSSQKVNKLKQATINLTY